MSQTTSGVARVSIFISAGIFVLALIPRVIYLVQYQSSAVFPVERYSDAFYYYLWATDLFCADSMGARVFMKWPLYAYALGGLLKLAGGSVMFAYIVQSVLGALNCVLVFFIGRKLFSRAAGIIAAVLCIAYGMFIFYDGLMIYVTLSLVLNSLFVLYVLFLKERACAVGMFAGGILLGICALAQGNILLFGVPALVLVGFAGGDRKRGARNAVMAMLGLVLALAPVTARNYAKGRDFVPVAGNLGINVFIGNNAAANGEFLPPRYLTWNQEGMFRDAKAIARWTTQQQLKPSQVSRFWAARAAAFAREHPLESLKLLFSKTASAFAVREPVHDIEFQSIKNSIGLFRAVPPAPWLIVPLGVFGMVVFARRIRTLWMPYLFVATQAAALIIFFVTTRYRMTYMPFLALFAGAAVWWLMERIRERDRRALLSAALILGFIAAALAVEWPTTAARSRAFAQECSRIAYASEGFKALQKKDYAAALRYADLARAAKPEHYAGLLLRAHTLMNAGRAWEAELALRETVNAFPYCVHARYFLARLLNDQGRFAEARAQAAGAVFLDEDFSDARYELGRAWQGLGDSDDARAEFEAAYRLTSCYYAADRLRIASTVRTL